MRTLIGQAGSKYLLDTVIIIGYFNNDVAIQQRLKEVTLCVTSTTIGELYFGAHNSRHAPRLLMNIHELLQISLVLPCTEHTADQYGQIKAALRAKGRPIPENDMWIAAAALEHGLILATRDAHFQEIDRLSVETW